MNCFCKLTLPVLCLAWASISTLAQDAPPPATKPPATAPTTRPGQAELEKKFEQTMTGAVLVGRFTARGREENAKEDRYTIVSAKKMLGDRWVITAKIQYRGADVAIPIVVPVKWADDTPVISVTDMTIPGMGSYTARVMIFKDEYAGMWDAGDHGGLMWGKIERADAAKTPAAKPDATGGAAPGERATPPSGPKQ